MAYASGSLISASDYNGFVGTNPSAAPNLLNTIYGEGSGRSGYGQTEVSLVPQDAVVSFSSWNALITAMNKIAKHQGTNIIDISIDADSIITAQIPAGSITSAFTTNLESLYTNRNNCAAQGAAIATTVTQRASWGTQIYFSHTITFDSGDDARNFFNAGGQIAITFSHPNGTGIDTLWTNLARDCGTIVVSAPSSGSAKVAGGTYTGVTKVGGSGTPTVLALNAGYYSLTSNYREIFKQVAASGNYKYLSSFISVNIKSNGTRGYNGDMGNVITIITKFDEIPEGMAGGTLASQGTAVTVALRPPGTSYINNTWGTPLIVGNMLSVNSSGYQGLVSGTQTSSLPGGAGEASFTNPGTYNWQAPQGITKVSIVCVGAGGGGGGAGSNSGPAGGGGSGGALAYKNDLDVIPGNNYKVVVGKGGGGGVFGAFGFSGEDSYFQYGTNDKVLAGGGKGGSGPSTRLSVAGGLPDKSRDTSIGGGQGGAGGSSGTSSSQAGAGGGAGGYTGIGGSGANNGVAGTATAGQGGGGGGGGAGSGTTSTVVGPYKVLTTRDNTPILGARFNKTNAYWSTFMNNNAVWNQDSTSNLFDVTYEEIFPYSADYTFTVAIDNTATIMLDGVAIYGTPNVNTFSLNPPASFVKTVTAGTHTVRILVANGSVRPGGAALSIDYAGGTVSGNSLGNAGAGGGVGLYGKGDDGSAGIDKTARGGGGGSGGANGIGGSNVLPKGGAFGGGGGGAGGSNLANGTTGGDGAGGAVRIIWAGNSGIARSFPNTNTGTV
jgi:hypothetical protein